MRRNIGGHAHGNAARAVYQQVGIARRQHRRLLPAAVVVLGEIHRILVEIFQQAERGAGQPRLGVTHRGWRIGIHAAEIALPVYQRQAHRPVLRHAGQRVVNRAVAMGVIVAHHVADNLGGFAIGPAGDEAAFHAGIQNAPVHRLQTVAHVGQGARHDYAHRVIEITGLHLIDDVDACVFAGRTAKGSGCFNVNGVVAHACFSCLAFGEIGL